MSQLTITEITPAFGADVTGVEPEVPLHPDDEAALREAFDTRGLLLFRGMEGMTSSYQRYLASTVIGKSGVAGEGATGTDEEDGAYFVSNRREGANAPFGRLLFHTDMMWADQPFQVLTLFAVEVEPPSVPTNFTSAAARWDALPDDLRSRIEDLHAVHVTGQQMRADPGDADDLLKPVRSQVRSTTKPIRYEHPRTGRSLLYVSQMMSDRVVELGDADSEQLLSELFAHLYDPDAVWSHDWANGDLVMWDNLAIQHARGNVDVEGPVRTLRKVIAPRPVLDATTESPKFATGG
jgi:alpha-ketoglutarate-dependent taurine dioxygenase